MHIAYDTCPLNERESAITETQPRIPVGATFPVHDRTARAERPDVQTPQFLSSDEFFAARRTMKIARARGDKRRRAAAKDSHMNRW